MDCADEAGKHAPEWGTVRHMWRSLRVFRQKYYML